MFKYFKKRRYLKFINAPYTHQIIVPYLQLPPGQEGPTKNDLKLIKKDIKTINKFLSKYIRYKDFAPFLKDLVSRNYHNVYWQHPKYTVKSVLKDNSFDYLQRSFAVRAAVVTNSPELSGLLTRLKILKFSANDISYLVSFDSVFNFYSFTANDLEDKVKKSIETNCENCKYPVFGSDEYPTSLLNYSAGTGFYLRCWECWTEVTYIKKSRISKILSKFKEALLSPKPKT